VVENGVTGVLAPHSDPDRLRKELESLVDNPARRQELGDAGRRAAHRYDPTLVAGQIEALYREAVARHVEGRRYRAARGQ
jgi:glycosyltransferase involved in cell wall biosynthesis